MSFAYEMQRHNAMELEIGSCTSAALKAVSVAHSDSLLVARPGFVALNWATSDRAVWSL